MQLVEKLSDLVRLLNDPAAISMAKDELLNANSLIRQKNYKTGSKEISTLLHQKFAISKEE